MNTQTFIFIFFTLGILISCNSEQEEKTKQVPEQTKAEEVVSEVEEPKDTIITEKVALSELKKADEIFEHYLKVKSNYVENLKSCTPQFANQVYLDFRKEINDVTQKLTFSESEILDDYEGVYDEGWVSLTGKQGSKFRKYMSNGLELWYIGEGITEIRLRPSVYVDLFSGRVTTDFQKYIQLEEMDDRHLMTNDGGLSISLEEMGSTVRRWEGFVQNNPKSELKIEAKEKYRMYQFWYLQGLDNTPVAEYTDGMIYPENKRNLKMYSSYYPDSPTTELINVLFENEGDYENMGYEFQLKQKEILQKL